MALGMTYNGANESTEEAMRNTLEFGDLSLEEINQSYKSLIESLRELDEDVDFNIANSIWYRDDLTFEKDFLDKCREYFDARVSGLDFSKSEEAKTTMNNWVDENTHSKINEIVDYVDPENDVMFLINAMYFYGTWIYQFNKDDTKDDLFYLPGGSTTECKMMEVRSNFKYFEDSLLQAIDIPYGNEIYSMTVFLPRKGKNIDLIIAGLTNEKWDEWINSFSEDSVNLYLPKFKLEYKIKEKLKEVLKQLGMEIAFDERANFTKMYKPGGIWIDRIIHKTFLEVDEEGTEAAAATCVVMGWGLNNPTTIRINRPFLFAIRERNSGTILFIGKIIEPF
jgi:serpin B